MMTNIGIIGAGMIASIHAKAAEKIGTNVIAVHDPRKESAETFGATHHCKVVESVEALLARDDIQGVVIAVPNDRHAELAIAALRAGKNILLEKPMAMSLQQCDEILKARNESGNVLQMGFVCRYSPAALKAKQILQSGHNDFLNNCADFYSISIE